MQKDNEKMRNRRFFSGIFHLFVIMLMFVCCIFVMSSCGDEEQAKDKETTAESELNKEELVVPNVIGMPYDEAVELCEKAGNGKCRFELIIKEEVKSDEPGETILEQSPEPGSNIEKNKEVIEIEVVISLSEDLIKLNDFSQKDKDEAEEELNALGLDVEIVEVFSEDIPKDRIVKQDPKAGSKVEKGDTVTLYISKGVDKDSKGIVVSDFVGKSDINALKSAIEKQGFICSFVEKYHPTVPAGEVISQTPSAGTKLEKGAKIIIYVSRGPENEKTVLKDESQSASETKDETENTESTDGAVKTDNTESSEKNEPAKEQGSSEKDNVADKTEKKNGEVEENASESVKKNVQHMTVFGPKDKESALVEVEVDGELIYSRELQKGKSADISIESERSEVVVEIYHDDVLQQKKTLTMS